MSGYSWTDCDAATDRSGWNSKVAEFFAYWLAIRPDPDRLPGRQHFDPVDIPRLLSRIWILDVVRGETPEAPIRFRYRLVGTKEVESLQREPTNRFFEEVHPDLSEEAPLARRMRHMVETGRATYRSGLASLSHKQGHARVENCMVPMARDGRSVDMLVALSVTYTFAGGET